MLVSKDIIKKALAGNLSGIDSHQKMMPPNRKFRDAHSDKKRMKPSSVLLLIFPDNNELYICLIKRPSNMTHHANQIAFPGGKIETGESALETALRETAEEVGINSEEIEILGTLSDLFVDVSGFLIHPFVGWTAKKPDFIINNDEVQKVVLFPFFKFRDNLEETELETISGILKIPCFHFDGEIIWGATAMILSELLDTIENQLTPE